MGARCWHLPRTASEQARKDSLKSPDVEGGRLRCALLALLLLPPTEVPQMADPDQRPAPLLWASPALTDWLTALIEIEFAEAHGQYVDYLMRLLSNVDTIPARNPAGSALFRLASLVFKRLRILWAIAGAGELRDTIRLSGCAVERLLTIEVAFLAVPRLAREATTRLRVTPSPEGWALVAIYGALDPQLERIQIRLDAQGHQMYTSDTFAEELSLAWRSLAPSV